MVDFSISGNAVRSLWSDTCTITHKVSSVNAITKRTEQVDEVLYADIPCRLSIKSMPGTSGSGHVSSLSQTTKLFVSPDVTVPAGSEIVVSHKGAVTEYKQSGQSMIYTNHQEITLELAQEYA